jgi:hypothetical protein
MGSERRRKQPRGKLPAQFSAPLRYHPGGRVRNVQMSRTVLSGNPYSRASFPYPTTYGMCRARSAATTSSLTFAF